MSGASGAGARGLPWVAAGLAGLVAASAPGACADEDAASPREPYTYSAAGASNVYVPPQAPPEDAGADGSVMLDDADRVDCEMHQQLATGTAAEYWRYRLGPTAAAFPDGGGALEQRLPEVNARLCFGPCDGEPTDWTGYSGQTLWLSSDSNTGLDRTRFIWSKHEGHGGAQYWHLYLLAPINAPQDGDGDSWYTAHPDPALEQESWLTAGGGALDVPRAIGRGRVTWGNHAIVAFGSGLVGATGSGNSGDEYPTLQLPAGRTPTGVAVTPNNELALVTLWNHEACTGELAVIALHDRGMPWMFPAKGFFSGLKLLGLVELTGLQAPTSVAATVSHSQWNWPNDTDLEAPGERDRWIAGEEGRTLAEAGYVVVASREENRVAFVDLGPLLRFIRSSYLGSAEDYQGTLAEGPDADGWPYPFDAAPEAMPVVLGTIEVDAPTVVVAGYDVGDRSYLDAAFGQRAYAATLDGDLVAFDTSALMGGVADLPAEVTRSSLCLNPTDVFYGRGSSTRDLMAFACRGDRRVLLVSPTGEILRTLADDRISDPVSVILVDSRGAGAVVVGDFTGRRVLSYLDGPVDAWGDAIFGPLPEDAEFAFAGALDLPAEVVALSAAEVP